MMSLQGSHVLLILKNRPVLPIQINLESILQNSFVESFTNTENYFQLENVLWMSL